MDLSSFLIRIIFLVIPGVVSSLLYRSLRGRTKRPDWEAYLEILAFSLINYCVAGFLFWISTEHGFKALRALYDDKLPIDGQVVSEIVGSAIAAVPVAFIASYFEQYKFINRIGKLLRATRRFGDEDVWDYLQRSPNVIWVLVRDHKFDLMYYGWAEAYSDPYKVREMLLRDVKVYRNSTGAHLYNSVGIYISRKAEDLTIELVPSQKSTKGLPLKGPKDSKDQGVLPTRKDKNSARGIQEQSE